MDLLNTLLINGYYYKFENTNLICALLGLLIFLLRPAFSILFMHFGIFKKNTAEQEIALQMYEKISMPSEKNTVKKDMSYGDKFKLPGGKLKLSLKMILFFILSYFCITKIYNTPTSFQSDGYELKIKYLIQRDKTIYKHNIESIYTNPLYPLGRYQDYYCNLTFYMKDEPHYKIQVDNQFCELEYQIQ